MSEGYEKKDVSVKGIAFGAAATVALIIIFIVGIRDYFVFNMEKSKYEQIVKNPNLDLMEILRKDKALLTGYGLIDKESGIYKIPIGQAMKLVVKDYNRKQ